jgi:PilZ domain
MNTSGNSVSEKVNARVASLHLDAVSNGILQECFRQFGVNIVSIEGDPLTLLSRQKFEACILRLYDPDAERVLSAARNSSSNRRIILYGIARNTREALQYSSYGINAVLDEPLEKQSVLRVARATHLLVVHELRRYVRIPVVVEAAIQSEAKNLFAMTLEVSAGGMSLRCESPISSAGPVRVELALPGRQRLAIQASVCWSRAAEKLYGLRFDPADPARAQVRDWIDQYLEIV